MPLLRSVPDSLVAKYVKFIEGLPQGERQTGADALCLRFNKIILGYPQLVTSEEREWETKFRQFEPFPDVDRAKRFELRDQVDRAKLVDEVCAHIADGEFGSVERSDNATWKCTKRGSAATIVTTIDVGGRIPLSYFHRVTTADGTQVFNSASFCSFFGLSTQTTWSLMTAENQSATLMIFRQCCARFIRGFEKIDVDG
jgi:hypothetical protein